MASTDNNKSAGKPAQRNRKPKQGAKKPDQRQSAKPDQQPDLQQDEKELIEAAVASPETFEAEAEAIVAEGSTGAASTAAAVAPLEILPAEAEAIVQEASTSVASTSTAVAPSETASRGALVPMDAYPIAPAASVDAFWIGFQAIAYAYRDHARRSLEETF